jgi:hypothetical protein
MQTYLVRRPGIAANAAELDAAFTRLRSAEGDSPAPRARWLRSYALRESSGRFGLACLFDAEDAGALQRHAERTRLPAQEVLPVATAMLARPFAPTGVYLVRRRAFCSTSAEVDRQMAGLPRIAAKAMAHELTWLRTYSVAEADGTFGTVCLYQARHGEALHEHARRAALPADEVTAVIGRVVFRDDAFELTATPSAWV